MPQQEEATVRGRLASAARPTREALWERRLEREAHYRMREGRETSLYSWYMAVGVMALRWTLAALGLYARGRRNARRFRLNRITFACPDLPPGLDGFTILHLSDLHLAEHAPDFADAVAEFLQGTEVDLCCITGDFRFGHCGPSEHVPAQMPRILSAIHARHGVYGVLGNHDLGSMVEPLGEAGVEILVNRGVRKDVRGDVLWLAGVDDPQGFRCDSLGWALDGTGRDNFTLLMAHGPALARTAAESGVNLYLCGHTHGGQICLPAKGPILTNAPGSPRSHIAGKWQVDGMHGYTTRGLGATDLPVRFRCPPDAGLITLRRGGPEANGAPRET